MSSLGNRRESDIVRLMMSNFTVEPINDRTDEFYVIFRGPKESLYEGGVWKLHVELAINYPYEPPTVTFVNKIFHPNINEQSGVICLDVINKSWSSVTDLVNVFEILIPQLLLYPNDSDGLNEDAIFLLMSDTEKFEQTVKDYCKRYAKEEDVIGSCSGAQISDEDDSEESEDEDAYSVDESSDAMAGHLEL
ncbi:hypothetical protein RND81_02G025300 [Saponaria officinalis]|uniref:Ubiquitin-conjugating enzyme E2 H n=1 Tax=Saponaria officinalis TaxID=3572 RepID=A0AAW1MPT8_SAPOF